MRTAVVVLLFLVGLAAGTGAATPATVSSHGTIIAATLLNAQDAPTKDVNVDVNLNHGTGGGRWFVSPVWLAIGGLAVLVVLVLIVAAMRGGGGTTIVHD
jgi:hypothetical protein